MNTETLLLVVATATTFMLVVGLALPFMKRDVLSSRLRAVTKRRQQLSEQQRIKAQPKKPRLSKSHLGMMKMILERFKIENPVNSPALRNTLAQAGYRGQTPVVVFAFTRLLLPIVLPLVAGFFLFVGNAFELSFMAKLATVGGVAFIGYYLPKVFIGNIISKRQLALTQSFPDALDLLVICVEAGLSLEAACARVSSEMAEGAPILSEEFGLTTVELAFLSDRRQALENLSARTGVAGIQSLCTALIQSEKYGTPLATTLRVISQESRDERMSRAEKKAASLPAKLTVPMILFFLPVVFFILIGPAIIQIVRI